MTLPKGYKMWIYPTYRLEAPKRLIPLSDKYGAILAMLIGRYQEPVFLAETMAFIHGQPDDGGPISYTGLIRNHVNYLRSYLRQHGVAANIKVVAGHDCAILRNIKEISPNAEQTSYVRLQAKRKPTKGVRRNPNQPPPYHNARADADPKAIVPYARHSRHEMAEKAGYYERPLTNEELTPLVCQR